MLKLVNGEVDYKSKSVQLESAPQLLDGAESGGYNFKLTQVVEQHYLALTLLSRYGKRKVYGDIRFRQAMSMHLIEMKLTMLLTMEWVL